MDPLTLLREFTVQKKAVKVEGDEIIFGDERFPSDMPTNYRSKMGHFYALNALVLFIQFADASVTDYLRASQNSKIAFIKTLDKQDLLNYLRGKITTSNQVQLNPAAGSFERGAKRQKTTLSAAAGRGSELGGVSGAAGAAVGKLSDEQLAAARKRHVRRLRRYLAVLKANRQRQSGTTGTGTAPPGAKVNNSKDKEKEKDAGKDKEAKDEAAAAAAEETGSGGTGGALGGMSLQKIAELKAKRLALKNKESGAGGEEDEEEEEEEEEDGADGEEFTPDPVLLRYDRPITAQIMSRQVNRYRLHGGNRTALLRAVEDTVTEEGSKDKEKEKINNLGIALMYYKEARNRERNELSRGAPDDQRDASRNKKRGRERGGGVGTGPFAMVAGAPVPTGPAGPAILIVPNVATAILNIYNIKDFLQDGKFVTGAEKKKQLDAKPSNVMIEWTKPSGRKLTFQIVDNPTRLKTQDWERVVGILVQGAAWQFKGWKYSQPLDIFQRYLGVHVQYEDEKIASTVQAWNVKTLRVNKHKRHLDQVAKNDFWRILQEWLAVHRPYLANF